MAKRNRVWVEVTSVAEHKVGSLIAVCVGAEGPAVALGVVCKQNAAKKRVLVELSAILPARGAKPFVP